LCNYKLVVTFDQDAEGQRVEFEFEWDDGKAYSNLRKHGVAFEDATAVFSDPRNVSTSAKIVDGEERVKTTGHADEYAILTVIHTQRIGSQAITVRMISARPASRRERRIYGDRSIQP
jgi:hypothetical protein